MFKNSMMVVRMKLIQVPVSVKPVITTTIMLIIVAVLVIQLLMDLTMAITIIIMSLKLMRIMMDKLNHFIPTR